MRIERRSYSRAPWRLVMDDGREVSAPQAFDHAALGATVINGPICGNTKTECTENALALLEALLSRPK